MENTAVLNVRISEQLKQQLEELAKEKNGTVSDLVREMLETAVTQDGDYVSGISSDLMARIKAEAQRRNMSTPKLIAILLQHAFEKLRKNTRVLVFDD